jgi:peptide methionine sulfoxide reductase MsrA
MKTCFYYFGLLLLSRASFVAALNTNSNSQSQPSAAAHVVSRRFVVQSAAVAALATTTVPLAASAATETTMNDNLIQVYFGCGCFWHVQHEFVEAERRILNRTDEQLTARAGYAGGIGGAKNGKVCYHNAAKVSEYGTLGHAEVVSLTITESSFAQFAQEYFALFSNDGLRPDQYGDRGPEYRNLIGIPGGYDNAVLIKQLVDASKKNGDKLDFAKGKGNDGDVPSVSFVMDTADFPVFVAEQYHQFHDGFKQGENYPSSYNDLAVKLAQQGTLGLSDCPNGMLGLGIGGL